MTNESGHPPAEKPGVVGLRRRAVAWLVAGAGALFAAGVSLSMAIYASASPETLGVAQAGQDIDTGRWRVNAIGAHFVPAKKDAASYVDRQNSVVVDFYVTNLSATSSVLSADVTKVDPPIPGLGEPIFYLQRDKSMLVALHPGMPEYVSAVWKWPDDTPPPPSVRLVLDGQIYKHRDNLYAAPNWLPGDPVASITLPVEVKAEAETQ